MHPVSATGLTRRGPFLNISAIVLLRHRADLRALANIGLYFVLLFTGWALWPGLPWAARLPLIILLGAVSWINAVITHNTLHCPMWRSRRLNRITQVALSLTYGFPVSEYVPGHNLSHHRYTQTRRDVMRTTKVRFRWNLLNLAAFFFVVGYDVTAANQRYAAVTRQRNPRWYRQFLLETAIVWGVKVAALLLDWRRGLLLVFLPHLWAVWGITTANLLQHDGCDENHEYNHSRNFVGRVFNWLAFNNGYHGIHHNEPALHWSLTAAAHAERFRPQMDPRLDEPSFVAYVLRAYFWPGKRLRYDGTPVVLPPEGKDEDWIRGAVAYDSLDPEAAARGVTG